VEHERLERYLLPEAPVASLDAWRALGGGQALEVARRLGVEGTIEELTASGLRGRGGAGFPTGRKWAGVLAATGTHRFVVCNAAEGEPATFKDRAILRANPYQVLEGVTVAAATLGAREAYVAIKGSCRELERLVSALEELEAAGLAGDVPINVVPGPDEYLFGEEKAMLEVIEGKPPLPRLLPPYEQGLFATGSQAGWEAVPREPGHGPEPDVANPTLANNVETLANLPHIITRGPEWFAAIGSPPKSTGTRIFCVSGHVKRPGNYEVPMGVTFRELIFEHAGGMRSDKPLKAIIPGGASAAFFTAEHLDVKLDFESVAQAGSMLGSGGVTVMEEGTSMVWAALRLMEFFYHESCGKCSPCREGSSWLVQTLRRILAKRGRKEDLETLVDLCQNIAGRTVCAFGDAEVAPVMSTLKHWRSEYEALIREAEALGLAGAPELVMPARH